ncbi:unnamed protein product [Ectocarpus sp. 13 AM-2016]
MTVAMTQLVSLCLTEIALPLGFSSCMKACSARRTVARNATTNQGREETTKLGPAAAGTSTTTRKIVPLDELPPLPP